MSKSKSLSQQITNICVETMISTASHAAASAGVVQSGTFQNIAGDFTLEDYSLDSEVVLSLTSFSDQSVQASVNQDVENKLRSFAESTVKGQTFGLQKVDQESISNSITDIKNALKVEMISTCFASAMTTQSLKVENIGGNAVVRGVRMKTVTDAFAKCVSSQSGMTEATVKLANDIASQSTVKVAGIDLTAVFTIFIIVAAICGAAYVYFKLFRK